MYLMKNYEKILAFGDSHVAGCELSTEISLAEYLAGNISLEDADLPGKKLAFPNRMSQILDIPCENYSLTGGSNQRSIRKLLDTVQENCLIVFGYTDSNRTEFYYPDDGLFLGRDDDMYIQTGIQWKGLIQSVYKDTKMHHPLNDLYLEKIHRMHDNINYIYKQADCIAKAHGCHIIHLPMASFTHNDMFNFEGHENYLNWCEYNNFKRLPYLHYNETAHQTLAELLCKNIGDTI